MNEYRRVVVTGMGVVSPVGSDITTCWDNLVSGYNGIGPITYFDTTNYKGSFADLTKGLEEVGKNVNCVIKAQQEEIFDMMHRI